MDDTARVLTLTRAEVRRRLVAHLGLARVLGKGARGVRATLERLRCIQLDPLDAIGTNADLVVMARVDDVARGDVWSCLFPKYAFEHFAKERCILPARAFPYYREQGHGAQTHWWRHAEREERVPPKLVRAVLEEIRERGPVTARDLTDHGSVAPIDWSGWMGTAKTTSMAIEILWTQCEIVVAGRTESGAKVYDVPERALRAVVESQRPVVESSSRRASPCGRSASACTRRDCSRARAARCGRCSAACVRRGSSTRWWSAAS